MLNRPLEDLKLFGEGFGTGFISRADRDQYRNNHKDKCIYLDYDDWKAVAIGEFKGGPITMRKFQNQSNDCKPDDNEAPGFVLPSPKEPGEYVSDNGFFMMLYRGSWRAILSRF